MQLWESMYATVFEECYYDGVSRPLNQVINQDGNQANNQKAIYKPQKRKKFTIKNGIQEKNIYYRSRSSLFLFRPRFIICTNFSHNGFICGCSINFSNSDNRFF